MANIAIYTCSEPPRRITATAAARAVGMAVQTMQDKFAGRSPMGVHELVLLAQVYPDLRIDVAAEQLARRYTERQRRRRARGQVQ